MSKNRMQKVTIVTPKGIKVECELKDTALMELRTTLKNGEEKKYIDEFYICPNCKKKIDEKDFLKTYCVTPENEKYTDNCKIVYDNGKSGRRYFFNGVFEK